MQQVFNDLGLPPINKLRPIPTCARVVSQSQVIEPAAELLAPFSWLVTSRQHGQVELLRALVPARGPATVHQVEALIRKWPFSSTPRLKRISSAASPTESVSKPTFLFHSQNSWSSLVLENGKAATPQCRWMWWSVRNFRSRESGLCQHMTGMLRYL